MPSASHALGFRPGAAPRSPWPTLLRIGAAVTVAAAVVGTSLVSVWHLGGVLLLAAGAAGVAAGARNPLTVLGWRPGRRFFWTLYAWVGAGHVVLMWAYFWEPNFRLMDSGVFADLLANLALRGRYYAELVHKHGLADHFDPTLALLAPLFRLYPTFLWLQAAKLVAFLVAPLVLLRLADCAFGGISRLRWLLPTLWLVSSVMAYGTFSWFQPSMLAPPLVLAAFLFAARGQGWRTALTLLLVFGLKENMFQVGVCLGVFLAVEQGRWRWGAALAAASVLLGLAVVFVVMPRFAAGETLRQYEMFGPTDLIGDKVEVVLATVLAVGGLSLLRLRSLGYVLPVFAVQLVSAEPRMLSFRFHYFMVPCTVAFVGAVYGLAAAARNEGSWPRWSDRKRAWAAAAILVLVAALNGTVPQYALRHHWPTAGGRLLVADVLRYRDQIPPDTVVYASDLIGTYLVPHAHLRRLSEGLGMDLGPRLVVLEGTAQPRGLSAAQIEAERRWLAGQGLRPKQAPASLLVYGSP